MKIALQLKANLENLTQLRPEGEDFRWYLKLQCMSCGEENKAFSYVTLEDSSPLKGGKGSASLVLKCKFCSRENSLDIIREKIGEYSADKSNTFQSIVGFECRGLTPVDFSPRSGWTAKGAESSTQFQVDLTEKEWCDYDENAQLSVGVYEVEHQFKKI